MNTQVDDFVKFLITNLPNFAGLIVALVVCIWIIIRQNEHIRRLEARVDELCGDDTPAND